MAEELKLLACPFCGGTKIGKNSDDGLFWETCQTCFADGPPTGKRSDEDAPTWNTRTELAALKAGGKEAVAYAAFADNGNIRMWCRSAIGMCELIDDHGNKAVPLYTRPSDPGTVPVRRELLERAANGLDDRMCIQCNGPICCMPNIRDLVQELRALLADEQGITK